MVCHVQIKNINIFRFLLSNMSEIELLIKVAALEKQIVDMEEKREKDMVQLYEHLQFMNFSQKIKDLENKVRSLENDLDRQKIRPTKI